MKVSSRKFLILNIILFLNASAIFCEKFIIKYSYPEKYQLTIKGDFKVYLNEKYMGLNVREVKGILDVEDNSKDQMKISGSIYQYKKTLRDNTEVGNEIDKSEVCKFILNQNGTITASGDSIFPPLFSVPFFPDKDLKPGDIYENNGIAFVSLFNLNDPAGINIISKTKYIGKKEFNGKTFDYFEITYFYKDLINVKSIKKANGQHNLGLFFDTNSSKPVFIKDIFSEEFELINGDIVKQNGFYFYFYKLIIPMNKDKMVVELKNDIDEKSLKDMEIVKKKEGVSITINNLKFKPDSKELLNEEKNKLIDLVNALKKIPDRSFMIVGHTALFGAREEQLNLSAERAKTISEYLIKNGIPQARIFFTGKGADEPAAPNDNEENMRKNRRVEIIIQED